MKEKNNKELGKNERVRDKAREEWRKRGRLDVSLFAGGTEASLSFSYRRCKRFSNKNNTFTINILEYVCILILTYE
jgi:hypothetical protein